MTPLYQDWLIVERVIQGSFCCINILLNWILFSLEYILIFASSQTMLITTGHTALFLINKTGEVSVLLYLGMSIEGKNKTFWGWIPFNDAITQIMYFGSFGNPKYYVICKMTSLCKCVLFFDVA